MIVFQVRTNDLKSIVFCFLKNDVISLNDWKYSSSNVFFSLKDTTVHENLIRSQERCTSLVQGVVG